MKSLLIKGFIIAPFIFMSACSFVSLDPQAKTVAVSLNPGSLGRCKSLGDVSVSLWSKADKIQSQENIEEQLDTLARNEAVKIKGNTVAPISEISHGKRTYRIYHCLTY